VSDPYLCTYKIEVFRNGVLVPGETINASPKKVVPTGYSLNYSHNLGTIAVSAGDEIEIRWTDNISTSC